jgi:hypothetical protein
VCDETSFASKGHTEAVRRLELDTGLPVEGRFAIYQKVKIHFHGFPFFQRPKANKQTKKEEEKGSSNEKYENIYIIIIITLFTLFPRFFFS